ncbi:bifunctional 4-hydroxy-2-oxoglutarate aldolase/2-dehydro-3-deoxy-phosphogluconate aldolase [Erythrobacter sp. EC-HK427]|uniref:bifunctional 4-hydroxy-2-oxoglutarate aldolase/2-dehydro-3-deoxy-phosphogluconate aldolase n=1 Tax=Erythrobacter sp. EC-HK427 TaxID=2038396 RepID=UPI0012569002|nr:bifunctional 4-hydroxy-2-oxoglutarate aldolase/2-dehydro-3-deoxy-phosphogluconate aldolase [Erythrobacter sp. EC-HK427]VVS98662.1 multifunctional 2-keto-3-deoxygluconate 6-phosphate aldolase and 2-keto-4-hydroxyglutarate aldolase and oxaloacetate decarboxylase [Erythrobacter sp. EC-HK427]
MSDTLPYKTGEIERIMKMGPVVPVLVVDDIGKARETAEALVEGGLKVLEVTLRTDCALDAIKRMNLVPGAIVGAGTVTGVETLQQALDAGSEFIVSPGLTTKLGEAALKAGVPLLPGIANSGDIMRGMELGLQHFKFFPAMAAGGIPALKALCGPFHTAKFCPTGGISAANAPEWLAMKQVLCVGGSWVAPAGASPEEIVALAREASGLGQGHTGQ